jgi:hypothetical protein
LIGAGLWTLHRRDAFGRDRPGQWLGVRTDGYGLLSVLCPTFR